MADSNPHAPVHPVASTSLHALHPAQVVPPPARAQLATVPAPVYSALSDSDDSDSESEPDWNAVSDLGALLNLSSERVHVRRPAR